jgi:hypothetical protein
MALPRISLQHSATALERARARPGVQALEELVVALPAVAPGSRVERLLRATQLLGGSLNGDHDDRFLRRWTAFEALVGTRDQNIVQTVARRGAWLLESTSTAREDRQRWLKELYDRRSKLSHGAVDRTRFDYDAVEFGWLSFEALERVAERTEALEIEEVYPSEAL